jgi:hypothetical protein
MVDWRMDSSSRYHSHANPGLFFLFGLQLSTQGGLIGHTVEFLITFAAAQPN